MAANSWSRLGIDGAGPTNRYGHSAVLDDESNRMIIFHGFTDSGRFDDKRAFDLCTNRWTEITGSVQPAARQHYGISFDTRRMQLILFGGSGRGSLSEAWTFNPQTRTWNQLTASGPTNLTHLVTSGIVNAFSGVGGAISPEELNSPFGDGLGPLEGQSAAFENDEIPRSLAGSIVEVNGNPARLLYAQLGQLNLEVPPNLDTSVPATGKAPSLTLGITAAPAELTHTGPISGTIGLIQINARIPAALRAGRPRRYSARPACPSALGRHYIGRCLSRDYLR
jgi:hypothetical protein